MQENGRPAVEVTADLQNRRLISRFSGFIKEGDALEAKRLYLEGLESFGGKAYTALTYFDELRILAPEAVEVFTSMVAAAGEHHCLRSARIIRSDQTTARMQLERIDNEMKNYESNFFHTEEEALRYLNEAERAAAK
ncbi:MAG: hypothetical protein GY906_16950 [bacterium]|nr:hypothetical protein [bacterium]